MNLESDASQFRRLNALATSPEPARLQDSGVLRDRQLTMLMQDYDLQQRELLSVCSRLTRARLEILALHARSAETQSAHASVLKDLQGRLTAAEARAEAQAEEMERQRRSIAGHLETIRNQALAAEQSRDLLSELDGLEAQSLEPLASAAEAAAPTPSIPSTNKRIIAARRLWLQLIYGMRQPLGPGGPLRITVVTPVFNAVDTVRATLESVLSQDHPNIEYIVVDGGSTDGTLALLEQYRPRLKALISEPDRGMYDAIGKGFDQASGDIFCYLNADDTFEPGSLSRVAAAFATRRPPKVVYFEDNIQIEGWKFPNARQPKADYISLERGQIISQDGVFFSGMAYHSVNGINRSLKLAGDWDLWVRMSRLHDFKKLTGRVSSFRIRVGQLSGDMGAYDAERESVRRKLPFTEYLKLLCIHILNRAGAFTGGWSRRDPARSLFYTADFAQMRPELGQSPEAEPIDLRSALDDRPLSDLLFSKANPRLGPPQIQWLYGRAGHADEVAAHPRLAPPMRLQRRAMSLRQADELRPADLSQGGSPYKGWVSPRPTLLATALRLAPIRLRSRAAPLDAEQHRVERIVGALGDGRGGLRVLDVGCAGGDLLNRLRERGWTTSGCEPVKAAADLARERGHEIWNIEPDQLTHRLPLERAFDAIVIGDAVEHFDNAQAALTQLFTLLHPGGRIVFTGPSLGSDQLKLFGPTWSGWHRSYCRYFFSPAGVRRLAVRAQLELVSLATWTTLTDTWLSQRLRESGIGLQVPLGRRPAPQGAPTAETLTVLTRRLSDWRGRGDNFCAVLRRSGENPGEDL